MSNRTKPGIFQDLPSFALLIIVLAAAVLSLIGCSPEQPYQEQISADKGIMNLRGIFDSSRDIVPLQGEWEFYWLQMLTPNDFQQGEFNPSGYITVPGIWNDNAVTEGPLPPYGYATLKLTVLIDDPAYIYAIQMHEVLTAYRLWVNGTEIKEVGVVGENPQEAVPRYEPQVIPFTLDSNRIEIVLQVSNFAYKDGGIRDVPFFGTDELLSKKYVHNLVLNYILFGALFIMALYHFSLFWLRREDKTALLFGIFCLVMTTRIPVTNEMLITEILPRLSWDTHIRIIVLGYYIAFPVFITYISVLYPEDFKKLPKRIVQGVGSVFSILVLITKPAFFTRTELFYQVFILLCIPYLLYGLIRAIIKKRNQAVLLIIGFFVLAAAAINDILYAQYYGNVYVLPSLVPLGLTIFILFQSYIISARFSYAFNIAYTDMLTRIPNRRRFLEVSEAAFLLARKNSNPLSVLYMDLDHFKEVNDTYGHEIGDIVLNQFAAIMESVVQPPDFIGRLGGEEFALMVHGNADRAIEVAEEIRKTTEEKIITVSDFSIQITVSIGISTNMASGYSSLKDMMITADKALYSAKRNGRNRVELLS